MDAIDGFGARDPGPDNFEVSLINHRSGELRHAHGRHDQRKWSFRRLTLSDLRSALSLPSSDRMWSLSTTFRAEAAQAVALTPGWERVRRRFIVARARMIEAAYDIHRFGMTIPASVGATFSAHQPLQEGGRHSNGFPTIERYRMLSTLAPGTAQAILAANRTNVDPAGAVRRLWVDRQHQLWVLTTAIDVARDGGISPADQEHVATGLTKLATVDVWLPVYVGWPGHTVAEVLVQVPDDLRGQVTGVHLHDGLVVGGVHYPTQPTEGNGDLEGWVLRRADLYRASSPVECWIEGPFALADSVFDETGVAGLILQGYLFDGRWEMAVSIQGSDGGLGALIGVVLTPSVEYPANGGDVIEATRTLLVDRVGPKATERYYSCLEHTYGLGEGGPSVTARLELARGI